PNPLLQVYVAEKTAANLVVAAHRHPHPHSRGAQCAKSATSFFSSLLEGSAEEERGEVGEEERLAGVGTA
ncbi:MAG TPA: hypothetical protein VM755_00075, partial [Stellaceae bacterium]|nr:hypothetical protein [Stellaceae bacterium]